MTPAVEEQVLAALDEEALIRSLQALVEVPSVTGDERRAQERMAELCHEAGLAVETWDIDLEALKADPDFPGLEAPRTEAVGLAARLGTGGGRRLVLNGHIDTVAAGTLPWRFGATSGRLEDGAVHGRGSLDMKGGLAAALAALRAVRAAGVELPGEVVLQSVVSEEDGGLGTFDAVRRLGGADAALIPEPSRLEVMCAQAGALTFEGVVTGRSAHAAYRLEGVSAIDRYVPLHQALHDYERRMNEDVEHPLMRELELPYPLLVGRLEAGEWSSSVPDRLTFEGRVGVPVGTPVEQVRAEVEALAEGVADLHWEGGQFASAVTPLDHPFVALVRRAAGDVLGAPPALRGVPYGADMRLFTAAGIPCVMCGPGDPHVAHTTDESLPVVDLVRAARMMALVVVRFLGGANVPG